jgi:hypothetical protein
MPSGNDSPSSSKALVRLVSVQDEPHVAAATTRPAAFLAHLIATRQQLPQTRARRRAEPSDVIAAYQAVMAKIQKLNNAG